MADMKMHRRKFALKVLGVKALGLLCLMTLFVSCSQKLEKQTFEIKPQPAPVEKVIAMLKGYQQGQPVGSEVTSLPALMKDMQEKSGDKVEVVQKAFDNIMKNTKNAKAIATEALKQLED